MCSGKCLKIVLNPSFLQTNKEQTKLGICNLSFSSSKTILISIQFLKAVFTVYTTDSLYKVGAYI